MPKVDWITYGRKHEDWRLVKVAVDGRVAEFSVHESDWRSYPSEAELRMMLIRQAQNLIQDQYQRR